MSVRTVNVIGELDVFPINDIVGLKFIPVNPNEAEANDNCPVTPKPPPVIFTLDANVVTPVTPRVEEAVNAPIEVREVLNVDAPVTPKPPEVTNSEVLNDLTPANVCAEVVTSPTSPTLAFGILNV